MDERTDIGIATTVRVHGTRSCYQAGCRQAACVAANRTYVRDWYRSRLRPDAVALRARVPAGPVRTHLLELLARGCTLLAISRATGLSQATLSRLARGQYSTVHRTTRSALYAFAPGHVASVKESSWDDVEDLAAALAQVIEDRTAAWRRHAACRHAGIPVDLFFVGRGEPAAPAKTICQSCPVIGDCGAYADRHHEQIGIWAGRAPKERRPGRREVA